VDIRHLCVVTNELMSNQYDKKSSEPELIDAFDRCLICYRLINAWGEPASGVLERAGDKEEEGLEPSSSSPPKVTRVLSPFLYL